MKYIYSGPTSGVTLRVDDAQQEVLLHTNSEVTLPDSHAYTKTLLALGHLTPVPQTNSVKPVRTKEISNGS